MYKPQEQTPGSTNTPSITPPSPSSSDALRVLAPEGHFPSWLQEEVKSLSPLQITTYKTVPQSKEKLQSQAFDLLLVPDRTLLEGITLQKVIPFPAPLLYPSEMPIPSFLNHPFDPRNQFGIPYGCTFYGFRYHKDAIPKPLKKWQEILSDEFFSQTDFPQDPELLFHLQLIAENLVGKLEKNIHPKSIQAPPQEELPIQVRTLSEFMKSQSQNPSWQTVLPEEGSVIELYHLCWGSAHTKLLDLSKKILNSLVNARLSEENGFSSTFKSVRQLQNPQIRKLLNPDENWMNKTIFIRPPRAAKASSS